MRLDDMLSKGRDEADIPAEVARELEILDAALRGEAVPPGSESIEALVSDLREERPEPEPRFEAELDAWAAAGFPRGQRPGTRAASNADPKPGGFFSRLSPSGPRGWTPVAAAAATLVVIGVSLSQVGDFGSDESVTGGTGAVEGEAGDVSGGAEAGGATAPSATEGPASTSLKDEALGVEGAEEPDAAGLSLEGQEGPYQSQEAFDADSRTQRSPIRGALNSESANRGQGKRRVERDAQLTLAAPADEVTDANGSVIGVVEGANGVVLTSRVTGTNETARATLEARVPSATLDDTLAALSELANVQSRTEHSQDITRTYVTARDHLVGLRASRDNLAERIREATTDAEVAALQSQLAGVNRQIADAKSELNEVETRAQLATVTIVITSEGAGTSDDDDGWSLGDALDEAGKVLEVGAGVALISAAVLVPLAIIAALAYFVVAAANRRARERTLDE